VQQDDGVVVDVDDPAVWSLALGDLVGVVGGRDAGSDVEELADACLALRYRTALARKARLDFTASAS